MSLDATVVTQLRKERDELFQTVEGLRLEHGVAYKEHDQAYQERDDA